MNKQNKTFLVRDNLINRGKEGLVIKKLYKKTNRKTLQL